jgi:hypothetical protein
MTTSHSLVASSAILTYALAAAIAVPAIAGTPQPHHVRGTVKAISANTLTVTTPDDSVRLNLPAHRKLVGVSPATAADIKPGTFIGTANVPDGSVARALEVVVFPASMRGTGEGNYPWDLPASGHASAMTNGTVGAPNLMASSGSSMTNASVTGVRGSGRLVVKVSYAGGTKTIAIPANTPIVRIVPATAQMLKPGAHVFVVASGDQASFIVVGENGAVPPM